MQDVLEQAERAARTDAKVLITGESGVGKDVVAHYIHASSARRNGQFVAVNCAGLTESLLESELFGHVRGAFTGAHRDKPGKLQAAHRGTLFLDEVGEMSLRMQGLLLRFLENGEVQAVGSDAPPAIVDVRIVAATNRNLLDMVHGGQFRSDLMYRLQVIHLHVPPLRDRPSDIRPLALHFVSASPHMLELTDEAWKLLERHRWPGNVRELRNVIEQLTSLRVSNAPIDAGQLPKTVRSSASAIVQQGERRRQVADELYEALVSGNYSFWEHIHPLFLNRDITRHDIRELVRRGLSVSRGSYRSLLRLFRMCPEDYKRFMNFLATHECGTEFREFRNPPVEAGGPRRRKLVALPPLPERRVPRDAFEEFDATHKKTGS
jgi:DNA-binding NtrC family response regulator